MAQLYLRITLLFLLMTNTVSSFYLRAQAYHGNADLVDQTVYLTRSGYLTASLSDADEFELTEDGYLKTFPGQQRSRPMGIFNSTLQKSGYAVLTSVELRSEKKITDYFLSTYNDDGEVLVFTNEVFKNHQREAIFVVKKSENLESNQVFAFSKFNDIDWKVWWLVDLVVLDKEKPLALPHEDSQWITEGLDL